jgi:hypothetical protein
MSHSMAGRRKYFDGFMHETAMKVIPLPLALHFPAWA